MEWPLLGAFLRVCMLQMTGLPMTKIKLRKALLFHEIIRNGLLSRTDPFSAIRYVTDCKESHLCL